MSRRRGRAPVPALALVLLVGCGGAGPAAGDAPRSVPAPAGVTVSVLQYRSDQTVRRVQIKVSNAGPAPVTVVAAHLGSPALVGEAAWRARDRADEAVVAPGTGIDLPAPLPSATCAPTAGGAPAAGGATGGVAALDLRAGDGRVGRAGPLPVTDPFDTVAAVREADCRREAALDVADIALVGPVRTRSRGGTLVGRVDLRLTPTGRPGRLSVDSIGPTTLLGPPTGATWRVGRGVGDGTGPVTVPLELRAVRCDPHAIAEDKLGTVLPLTVRVGTGPPGVVTVAADGRLRVGLQDFVRRACAPA